MKIEQIQTAFQFFNDAIFSTHFKCSGPRFSSIEDLWTGDAPPPDLQKKLDTAMQIQSQLDDSTTPILKGLTHLVIDVYKQDIEAQTIANKITKAGIAFISFAAVTILSYALKATLLGVLFGCSTAFFIFSLLYFVISYAIISSHESKDQEKFKTIAMNAMRTNSNHDQPSSRLTQAVNKIKKKAQEVLTASIDARPFFDEIFREAASLNTSDNYHIECKNPYTNTRQLAYPRGDVVTAQESISAPWFKVELVKTEIVVEK